MIWFTILVISLIFVVAVNESHLKADKLATEIRFLQSDMRIQNKINDSLRSSMDALLKMHTDKIITCSKMEHMDIND